MSNAKDPRELMDGHLGIPLQCGVLEAVLRRGSVEPLELAKNGMVGESGL